MKTTEPEMKRFELAQHLIDKVCEREGVPRDLVMSHRRTASIVAVRHEAMYQVYMQTGLSTPEIGLLFNRDHTTIIHAIKKRTENGNERSNL